ncbi:glycosyltransferase [Microbacterium hydrothermale]|uniref:glycosyltransferase n=1 Tax=Microbacterium hydrothermale TaxID=857427 RepID=UPI00142E41DD|nr:glycosyltransferase [Microbacterium hydrothermale]
MSTPATPPNPDDLTVVTVTYADRWEVGLAATAASVLGDPRTHLIVVCNGVSANTLRNVRTLAAKHPSRVDLIVFDRNRGSAPAFAEGLSAGYRRRTPVLILDDDNPLPSGAIDRLRAVTATLNERGAAPTALACFRSVNPVHSLLREGLPPEELFAELRPGAFASTDLFRVRRTADDSREQLETSRARERLVPLGNTMWGGTFLPAEVAALGILPPSELVLYGDDNAFSASLRSAGVDLRLCLDIEIHDTVDWRRSAEPARGLIRVPRVLRTPEEQLWRVKYQARNAAYLSSVQSRGSRSARVRLGVNAAVRLGLLLVAALAVGRLKVFGAIWSASMDGLRNRLGESYPLPGNEVR